MSGFSSPLTNLEHYQDEDGTLLTVTKVRTDLNVRACAQGRITQCSTEARYSDQAFER